MEDLRCPDGLVGVTDRVAEVQQISQSAFPLVRAHDLCLDSGASENDPLEHLLNALKSARTCGLLQSGHDRICALFQALKFRLVPDRGCLDNLSHAIADLSLVQSLQESEIDVNSLRLPERTNEVLAHGHVNRSLAANAAVDHGQQRRWDLDETHTAHVGRGDKSNHVADDAASQCEDNGVSCASLLQQPVLYVGLGLPALRCLTRLDAVVDQ